MRGGVIAVFGPESQTFEELMNDFFQNVWKTIASIGFFDIIDILIIALLVYYVVKLVRDTRAMQFVKGIFLLLLVYIIVQVLPFRAMNFIMRQVLTIGATALVVVFQPELRRALERVGRTRLPVSLFGGQQNTSSTQAELSQAIDEFRKASENLSRTRTGALMVFEMQTRLGEIIKTGVELDCRPVSELICTIFFPNTQLHDGAMVIRDGRIRAAGCFLPLTETDELSKQLGTRHRASVGMSENSDAIVVVVSEETGVISIARNGQLTRGFTPDTLGEYLRSELLPEETAAQRRERKLSLRRAKK